MHIIKDSNSSKEKYYSSIFVEKDNNEIAILSGIGHEFRIYVVLVIFNCDGKIHPKYHTIEQSDDDIQICIDLLIEEEYI